MFTQVATAFLVLVGFRMEWSTEELVHPAALDQRFKVTENSQTGSKRNAPSMGASWVVLVWERKETQSTRKDDSA